MVSNALELKNISVIYGEGTPFRKAALDNINLSFPKGLTTGIIGHTGSGKSTLASLMNGLLRPTEGSILRKRYLEKTEGKEKNPKQRRTRFSISRISAFRRGRRIGYCVRPEEYGSVSRRNRKKSQACLGVLRYFGTRAEKITL